MRAIVHQGAGGPEVLALADRPDPVPGPGQVLVAVRAAGLNRADILQRRGGYPAPPGWPADIPGLEYAGQVAALGSDVTRWRPGDRVMGLVGGGGQAEQVVVHEDEAIRIPDGMSWTDAAAIPEAFLTAWDALRQGGLAPGHRVLVHAAASGVGTAAAQLARWAGATVLGTTRSPDKLARLADYGVHQAIDTSAGGFREAVDPAVDLILDVLGGPSLSENMAVLAPRGRIVVLGLLQGPEFAGSLAPILRKRLGLIGTVMRSRALEERVALARAFEAEVLPAFASGTDGAPPLRPVVDAVYPMAEVARAHRELEANRTFGKLILEW